MNSIGDFRTFISEELDDIAVCTATIFRFKIRNTLVDRRRTQRKPKKANIGFECASSDRSFDHVALRSSQVALADVDPMPSDCVNFLNAALRPILASAARPTRPPAPVADGRASDAKAPLRG
jgi:hypothetical protein